jgi:hypothetical protein
VKPRRRSRTVAVLAVLAAGVLTACGASAPPAKELAIEVIDSMEQREEITAEAAICMRAEVEKFEGETLDDIAALADAGDTRGLEALAEFEAALTACR